MPSSNKRYIPEFSEEETARPCGNGQTTVGMLDSLFGYRFPYMMCMQTRRLTAIRLFGRLPIFISSFPAHAQRREGQIQRFLPKPDAGRIATQPVPRETAGELRSSLSAIPSSDPGCKSSRKPPQGGFLHDTKFCYRFVNFFHFHTRN